MEEEIITIAIIAIVSAIILHFLFKLVNLTPPVFKRNIRFFNKRYKFRDFKSKENVLIHILWLTPMYDIIMGIYWIYYFIFDYIPRNINHYVNLPDTEKEKQ